MRKFALDSEEISEESLWSLNSPETESSFCAFVNNKENTNNIMPPSEPPGTRSKRWVGHTDSFNNDRLTNDSLSSAAEAEEGSCCHTQNKSDNSLLLTYEQNRDMFVNASKQIKSNKEKNSLSIKMAYYYKNSSRKIFSNSFVILQLFVLSSFLISISSSSEITSFQQQQQQQFSSSSNNNNNNANSNVYNNNNNNGVYNSATGSSISSSQQSFQLQQSVVPTASTASLSSSSNPSVLTAYFIAGLANQIRKINSTQIMIHSQSEPFQLQFRTACSFGNIVYDDKFTVGINSLGNMTYSTKPTEFPSSIYHSVADGQWHSITFSGSLISLDDHDFHPQLIEERASPAINWDTNSSAENEQSKLNHMLSFFDGFVGCIRVPKPTHEHPTGGREQDLQSHEESFYAPESPAEHRMLSLLDLFQLRGVDAFPPCNDTGIDLASIHSCFNPDNFVLCNKCQNGATCAPDSTSDNPMNNQCVCPPNTEDVEYSGRYCEYPPASQQTEDSNRQFVSHEIDESDNEAAPISSPSNIDATSSNTSMSDTSAVRMVTDNLPELIPTTTTTEKPPEKPFSLVGGVCPCQHAGICTPSSIHVGQHYCNCIGTGYEGTYCDIDINECNLNPTKCNNGVCINQNGSYACYCRPGFAGKHCEKNFDECLSNPCKHGACFDLVDEYRCECDPGFEGLDCENEINECNSDPCQNGATCEDLLNNFFCSCQPGYNGTTCEIDINECDPNQCQNDGQCIDKVNGYECNCTETGFRGKDCNENVDDCLNDSCKHGGTCIDGVKGYNCSCYPGYEGHDCENDIDECLSIPCKNDGNCYQKSNQSLFDLPYNDRLRELLSNEFSYETAAGYVCICQDGYEGENCEIDIDECERAGNPCGRNGECIDEISAYRCSCNKGFMGTHCEIEINECDSSPCVKGLCIDKVGDFECDCPDGFGAKNCSIPLVGCIKSPCGSSGKCEATYDESTNKHNFKCECNAGFAGDTCRMKTTMSFNGSGPVEIHNNDKPFEIGNYELLLKFRTTLPDVLLVLGQGITYFSLILSGGKLNLQSSLLNNLKGISSGTNLANGDWHKVWIAVNVSHIALAADSEQTIYPISEGQDAHTGFNVTVLGGAAHLGFLNQKNRSPFIGCMQDIIINGERIIPGENLNATTIEVGCKRTNQCAPSPCKNLGTCTDLWQNFTCNCPRPYLGDKCQHEYVAATFDHETTSNSLAVVDILPDISNKFASTFDISLFVRTRQRNGTIFLLGNENNGNYSVFLEAEVGEVGNLVVQAKWSDGVDEANSKQETYAVDGLQLTDGSTHLISIQRDKGLVKISVNGTEHFRKSVSNRIKFQPTVLYIGGKPTFPEPSANPNQIEGRAAPVSGEETEAGEDSTSHPEGIASDSELTTRESQNGTQSRPLINDNGSLIVSRPFKGVIQDVRVNFSSTEFAPTGFGHGQHAKIQNHYVVEFFPLEINSTYTMGEKLGKVTHQNILNGTVSDDACKLNPCLNSGVCEITWNDFTCRCADGYDGKMCEVLLHCAIVKCPRGSVCHNLGWSGFECVAETAFDGKGTISPHYHLMSSELENVTFNEASFKFRTKQTGNVLYMANGSRSLRIGVEVDFDSKLNHSVGSVAIYIDGERYSAIPKIQILDGSWHTISTKFMINENGPLKVLVDEQEQTLTPIIDLISSNFLNSLVTSAQTEIVIGSHIEHRDRYNVDHFEASGNHIGHPEDAHNSFYRGCLADIKIGDYRLPFVTPSQLESINHENTTLARKTAPTAFYIDESRSGGTQNLHLGCILCYEDECENKGHCDSPNEKFECSCVSGFEGDRCTENIDECIDNECRNGATCKDEIANYTCLCPPGYTGWQCETDIDECDPPNGESPCKNGGSCIDGINKYTCYCSEDFFGLQCEKRKRSSCKDAPCENGASCRDRDASSHSDVTFECICERGYEGETCSERIDHCKDNPCENGGSCINKFVGFECQCPLGYSDPRCTTDINDCLPNPCLHNGTCEDRVNDYTCHCQSTGFSGPHCEIDVNECEIPDICPGVQKCQNSIGSFKCVCPDLLMCGENCDLIDPCYEDGNNKTCHNGGTCKSTCHDQDDRQWDCDCTENYGGQFCEFLSMAQPDQQIDILLIIIPVIAAFLIAATIGVVILVRMARKKRATRGVYSPSQQEYCNPRVELDNVMKPPPEERLI